LSTILTGGSGLLGQELQKHIKFLAPSHKEFDITKTDEQVIRGNFNPDKDRIDLIVHCAAFTDLVRAEKEKQLCYDTNVTGTRNLASLSIPMLYISTEYVFDGTKGNYEEKDYPNPKNFYALTKLLGECESRRTRSTVVRCLFKPRPFKHDAVCVDMFTSGDYVERIAQEIALAIKIFNKLPPTLHIGTGKKKLIDLARQTREVKEIRRDDVTGVRLPLDTSLNCSLWERIKNDNRLCES